MKKFFYFTAALLFFACTTDDPAKGVSKEPINSVLQKLIVSHNENEPFHQGEYSTKEMVVGLVDNNLVLANKVKDSYEDYYIIQLFEKDVETFQNLKSDTIGVADLGAELIFHIGDEAYYFSTLNEIQYEESLQQAQLVPVIGISKHIPNNSIVARGGADDKDEGLVDLVNLGKCRCVWWSSYERCESGGEGAKSCSNSDCAVSCNEGYYACCNKDPI